MQQYPEAKVILTVRKNPTVWYKSARRVSLAFHSSLSLDYGRHLFYHWNPLGRYIFRSLNTSYLQHFLDVNDQEATEAQYVEWIRKVQDVVPGERLLVYKVEDEWEPLCNFLGMETPDTQFPRATEYMHVGDIVLSTIGWLTVLLPPFLMVCCFVKPRRSKQKAE